MSESTIQLRRRLLIEQINECADVALLLRVDRMLAGLEDDDDDEVIETRPAPGPVLEPEVVHVKKKQRAKRREGIGYPAVKTMKEKRVRGNESELLDHWQNVLHKPVPNKSRAQQETWVRRGCQQAGRNIRTWVDGRWSALDWDEDKDIDLERDPTANHPARAKGPDGKPVK
jgi:hypothetical protein